MILDLQPPELWVVNDVGKLPGWWYCSSSPKRLTMLLSQLALTKRSSKPPALGVRKNPETKCFAEEGSWMASSAPFDQTTVRTDVTRSLSSVSMNYYMKTWSSRSAFVSQSLKVWVFTISLSYPFLNSETLSLCPLKFIYPLHFELNLKKFALTGLAQ